MDNRDKFCDVFYMPYLAHQSQAVVAERLAYQTARHEVRGSNPTLHLFYSLYLNIVVRGPNSSFFCDLYKHTGRDFIVDITNIDPWEHF